jgi:NADH dehydrogenase FAD-containing subunit
MFDKKSVVIIGGGHAGTAIARSLSSKLDESKHTLTLITARPFFVFQPALVRLTVTGDEDLASQVLMPYDHLFTNGVGKVVTGTVEKIEDQKEGGNVVLNSGERVSYHILVLATGSNWNVVNPPSSQEEASNWLKTTSTSIHNSKSIVLVGGGSIGAEFAGEIQDVYPVCSFFNVSLDFSPTHISCLCRKPKSLLCTVTDFC